jgi:hypothetical protein
MGEMTGQVLTGATIRAFGQNSSEGGLRDYPIVFLDPLACIGIAWLFGLGYPTSWAWVGLYAAMGDNDDL